MNKIFNKQYLGNMSRDIYEDLKTFLKRSYQFLLDHPYIQFLLVFSLFFICFDVVYFSVVTLVTSDDHFFHFRFAQVVRDDGLINAFKNFTAIYFSKIVINKSYFLYHNFLFYLAIIPFTYIQPLFLGIKLYAVFAASLIFAVLYWCIKKFSIKYAFLWTLFVFAFTGYSSIWRFLLSRPYALAPAILMLMLLACHKKKWLWVFVLSFVYVLWHSATFFFPIIIVPVYLVFEAFYKNKPQFSLLWAMLGGTALAIAVCYLAGSNFLLYSYDNIFKIYVDTILGKKVNIQEGSELYPMNFFDFIKDNAFMFVFMIIAVFIEIGQYLYLRGNEDLDEAALSAKDNRNVLRGTLFTLTLLFFLGTIAASTRFNDFFVFFVGLYVVLVFDYTLSYISITKKYIKQSQFAAIICVSIYLFVANFVSLDQMLASGAPPYTFSEIGNWLETHTNKGDIIFNVTWDWFPQLYYNDPYNNYIAGLEPRFLYNYSPKLYWLWIHIGSNGYVCSTENCPSEDDASELALNNPLKNKSYFVNEGKQIKKVLEDDFKSKYIVTSKDYLALNDVLDLSGEFKKVYTESGYYYIYEIKS